MVNDLGASSLVAQVKKANLAALAGSDAVEQLSLDAKIRGHQSPDPSVDPSQPPITQDVLRAILGLPATASGATGAGVGVAILDSGIRDAGDFNGRITAFYDFTNGGRPMPPSDGYGHGTHVAGLIGSDGSQSGGHYLGIAPAVSLIGMKVLDDAGNGLTSAVIAAVNFATVNRRALGIDIINLSLGHPIYEEAATDPLVQAVEQAVASGIVVVVSAGNDGIDPETGQVGYAGIESPGNSPSAITVGAVGRSTRSHAPTIRWPITAREGRHGSTISPSPISSRPASGWCPIPRTGA